MDNSAYNHFEVFQYFLTTSPISNGTTNQRARPVHPPERASLPGRKGKRSQSI